MLNQDFLLYGKSNKLLVHLLNNVCFVCVLMQSSIIVPPVLGMYK